MRQLNICRSHQQFRTQAESTCLFYEPIKNIHLAFSYCSFPLPWGSPSFICPQYLPLQRVSERKVFSIGVSSSHRKMCLYPSPQGVIKRRRLQYLGWPIAPSYMSRKDFFTIVSRLFPGWTIRTGTPKKIEERSTILYVYVVFVLLICRVRESML